MRKKNSSDLDALIKNVAKDYFQNEIRVKSARVLSEQIQIHQIKSLLEFSNQVEKHPLTRRDLPFDQLLLAYSPCYRKTRELADALGIKLRPKKQTKTQIALNFDTGSDTVYYSPVSSELIQKISKAKNPSDAKKAFFQIRQYFTLSYHDLNHAICFYLCPPKQRFLEAGTKKEKQEYVTNYLSWIESLVYLRDLQQIEEMGLTMKILYDQKGLASVFPQRAYESGRLTLKKFKNLQTVGFQRIQKHPEVRAWVQQYIKKYGYEIRVPKLRAKPMSKKHAQMRVSVMSPAEWRKQSLSQKKLFTWFQQVFGCPRSKMSLY